jgi:hypothetical protein
MPPTKRKPGRGGARLGAGRPRTGVRASAPVSFRLPADLDRELGEEAQRAGTSRHLAAAEIFAEGLAARRASVE